MMQGRIDIDRRVVSTNLHLSCCNIGALPRSEAL